MSGEAKNSKNMYFLTKLSKKIDFSQNFKCLEKNFFSEKKFVMRGTFLKKAELKNLQ